MKTTIISLCLMSLFLVGCASTPRNVRCYEGLPRSTNEVAILKAYKDMQYLASVRVVDNDPLDNGKRPFNETEEIELLPGQHTIEVSYYGSGWSLSNAKLTFNCDAGHVYWVRVAPVKDGFGPALKRALVGGRFHWTAWIVDKGNREVVAGQPREGLDIRCTTDK